MASHDFDAPRLYVDAPLSLGAGCPRSRESQLSPQCPAAEGCQFGSDLQRAGWRMAGRNRRRRPQSRGSRLSSNKPVRRPGRRPHLRFRAPQACSPRLHGAESGGDGGGRPAAGQDPSYTEHSDQSRSHARQRHRGGRTMRDVDTAAKSARNRNFASFIKGLEADRLLVFCDEDAPVSNPLMALRDSP